MNNLRVFNNAEFGQVRVIEKDGEPFFVGKDVAEILGYGDGNTSSKALSNAINDHVDDEDKILLPYSEFKKYQNGDLKNISHYGAYVINESGVYSLILRSTLPTAKKFKHWITSEVLPSIRKHGGYIAGQEQMTDEELLAKALLMAQSKIEEKDKQIAAMKPKALFADAVAASSTSILVGDLAKILKQNGIDIGQRRLFDWLRENGYLIKQKGASWNMPTQKAMDKKLFEIKETTINHSDGHISINKTVKVSGIGQTYFVNKFLGEKNEAV